MQIINKAISDQHMLPLLYLQQQKKWDTTQKYSSRRMVVQIISHYYNELLYSL